MVVLDENQLAVDYQLDEKNLVIYSLGASRVQVEYDTNSLTSKENEVWTLILDNPYSLTVFFPENSTVVYLSSVPTVINTTDNEISLCVNSGQWEISYLLRLLTEDQNNQNQDSQGAVAIPLEYLIIAIVALLVVLFVTVLVLRRKRRFNIKKAFNANPQLMKEERDVLQFLAERDGKGFEAEIRERFPDMPRTSLWRLVKRLEKRNWK